MKEITALETKALLDAQAKLRLIDCREANEHAFCRIEGSELIPLSVFAEEADQKLTNRTETIIIYCHAGVRSARAALFLSRLGYTDVRSLQGGIEAWSLEVDPTVPRY